MKTVAVNLDVPEEMDKYLREEAERRLTSKSALIREAIKEKWDREKPTTRTQKRTPVAA